MDIPKDFKLANTVLSFLEDSAGLVLGEFEADVTVYKEDFKTVFICKVEYPGDSPVLQISPTENGEASVSMTAEDGTSFYPMKVVFETFDDEARLLKLFVYPQIEISALRYPVAIVLANLINMRSIFGSTVVYKVEDEVHVQWKTSCLFNSEIPSQEFLKTFLESGVVNVFGWWDQYLALASTKLSAEKIINES